MANKTIEIYCLAHPITGEIRYIGKANNTANRLKSHLRDSTRRNTPVYSWIRKLASQGLTPTASIIEKCDNETWKDTEIRLIAEYRKTHRLLNVANGGDEPFCPMSVRQANGRNVSALRVSTEIKAKVYHLNQMVGILRHNGRITEAHKDKLRYVAMKRPDLFGQWGNIHGQ